MATTASRRRLFRDFKKLQDKGYDEIRPDLQGITVQVDLGLKDTKGNPVLETKNLEDLREIRSQVLRLFDFGNGPNSDNNEISHEINKN